MWVTPKTMPDLTAEAGELIVRDFLIKEGLHKTLAALNDECNEVCNTTLNY